METENELSDKVIAFCEALKNHNSGEISKPFVDAIINSFLFKEMYDCAYNEKMFHIRNQI